MSSSSSSEVENGITVDATVPELRREDGRDDGRSFGDAKIDGGVAGAHPPPKFLAATNLEANRKAFLPENA